MITSKAQRLISPILAEKGALEDEVARLTAEVQRLTAALSHSPVEAEMAPAPVDHVTAPNFGTYGSSTAMFDVIAERLRQQEKEGWTPEHDDDHTDGSLALAAGSYCESAARPKILARKPGGAFAIPKLWPQSWSRDWWKPKSPREDLVRAGALIIAEIERLDRAALATEGSAE